MTRLYVLGAARSGVAAVAHALAQSETATLRAGLTETPGEENIIALAPDEAPDCRNLAAMPDLLRRNPEDRAIAVWRQGVDFVNSRLRSRPGVHFAEHCRLWSRSLELAQRLQQTFPDRVGLIEPRALLETPTGADGRRRALATGLKTTGDGLARLLKASPSRGDSCIGPRPIVDADRAGWSMGEVEVFERICGKALRTIGTSVNLAAAERRRPLDLGRMLFERAYRFGGIEMVTAGASWKIVVPAGDARRALGFRLTAVAANGRRRLKLRALMKTSDPPCYLRWEVVEALTGRPLFATSALGLGEPNARIDALLPAHDGWIELAVTCSIATPGNQIEIDLREAKLSS